MSATIGSGIGVLAPGPHPGGGSTTNTTTARQFVSSWHGYRPAYNQSTNPFALADEAFRDGLKIFTQHLTEDDQKKKNAAALQSAGIDGILRDVEDARKTYSAQRSSSTARECVTSFANRACHYSNVLDVFVQHHPEYMALGWGTIKVLFGAIVEHEKTGTTIVQALCEVADALPQVKLATVLYPTDEMKRAVAALYAHIIRFLMRALKWYQEGKLRRAIHSLTQPVDLRYADMVTTIRTDTQAIRQLSMSCSQAEQRDMHDHLLYIRETSDLARAEGSQGTQQLANQLASLTTLVEQLQRSISNQHTLSQQTLVKMDDKLDHIQLSQSQQLLLAQCTIDHIANLRRSVLIRDCSQLQRGHTSTSYWTAGAVQAWNASTTTNALLVRGTYRQKRTFSDFCASAVQQLGQSQIATLHILRTSGNPYSLAEVLKSLACQAVSQAYTLQTTASTALIHQKFTNAPNPEDFVNLIGERLQHERLVYIILDADAMDPSTALQSRVALRLLGQKLAEKGAQTIVRILVTSCGAAGFTDLVEDACLKVGKVKHKMAIPQTRTLRLAGRGRGGRHLAGLSL